MPENNPTGWLVQHWAQQLGLAIEGMTGESARVQPVEADGAEPDAQEALVWRQAVGASSDAALWCAVPAAAWTLVGGQVLNAAGIENPAREEVLSTFQEVLQQSFSALSGPLGARLEREVEIPAGTVAQNLPPGLEWRAVAVECGGRQAGPVWLAAAPALLMALQPVSRVLPASESSSFAGKPSKTMDLLMEVELPVGVSFGRAQMRLKDAIKLTTGSIVELNRSVSEPVEIIVNNCVIARGEVVVVEGNYGVRIKQIVSREERLRTLF